MRKTLILLAVLVALAAGWWLYKNASIDRLRAEFQPWMARLERWRDANEAIRRALRSREATAADPEGVAALRSWAWEGLERLGYVEYRVEKPTHEIGENREKTTGRVVFTVGGFRADGARVERAARAVVTEESSPPGQGSRYSLRLEAALWNRIETNPRFHEATADAGLGAPRHDPPIKKVNHLIADIWPGSGVAVLDYDRDGNEDLFVGDGVRSVLYRNDGHGHFTDVTEKAGLAKSATEGIPATGLAAGDIDGDGYPDLFVTNAFGPARLFHNRGDGTFEETTATSGIAVPENMRSAAFADVDGDGDLDLFVGVTGDYYTQMPDPAFDANDGRQNFLYLNDGHGRFTDATKAWGLAGMTRWTLSTLFQDYDQDGHEDLMATNDFGLKNLYRNEGGKRFVDVAKKTGTQARAYGMSGTWADFDGDGRPDLYATGTDTQWYFLHEYPAIPVGLAGRLFLPFAIRWCEDMASGNTLLLQRADHTFERRDGALGRAARRLELELRRRGPRRRRLARHLRHQRDVGRRARPRRRARVLVADARLLGRLRRGHEDVRPQGRRHQRHRARPVLPQPRRRRGGNSPVRGARLSRRPRPRDERPGRRRLRRQRRRRARSLHPLGRRAGGPLSRIAPARTSTSSASASRERPARTTATASARASRRSSRAAARS